MGRHKGYKHSAETIEKLKGSNGMYIRTDKTKDKMRKIMSGRDVSGWIWKTHEKIKDGIKNGNIKYESGENARNWKGGSITTQGYKMITVDGKQILEHRKVWEECNLIEIPNGHHVHHIDGNKLNNDIGNLMMLSASEHRKLHLNIMKGGKKIMENNKIENVC